MKKLGVTLDSSSFVNRFGGMNSAASMLLRSFPDFVDPQGTTECAMVASILQKFDYVLTTEGLDEQARLIMPHWDLPANMERKRVATDNEKKSDAKSGAAGARNGAKGTANGEGVTQKKQFYRGLRIVAKPCNYL